MTGRTGPAGAGVDAWGRRRPPPPRPAHRSEAAPTSPSWFDRRGRPRSARRSGRLLLAVVLVLGSLLALTSFALAADISNHTVLSNGVPEHRGSLADPVWIPPADASWDVAPPSPSYDGDRPDHRPAAVDPPTAPGRAAPPPPSSPVARTSASSTTTTPITASTSSSTSSATSSSTTSPSATSPSATSSFTPSSTTSSSTGTSTSTATSPVDVPPDTAAAVAALNDARAAAGCRALLLDARLVESARDHAEELAAGTGDTGPAGRMTAAGYPSPGAENVARGQASLDEATAQLLASPSHRANVVDCSMRGVGLAHAAGTEGDYWVQDLGR